MSEWDRGAAVSSKVNLRISEINHRINFEFEFAEVVTMILDLIEDTSVFRECVLSRITSDMRKQPQFYSSSLDGVDITKRRALISLPITLTNNELKYTLDVFKLDSPQLPQREFSKLSDEFHSLLYQAVNKDFIQRDPLTGVFNRAYFNTRLEEELAKAKKTPDGNLALAISDLDHFKNVNDTYGHPVGDAVLKAFAEAANSITTGDAFFVRYGGEEFTIVMPGYNADQALELSENIRIQCSKLTVAADAGGGSFVRPTVSIGIALYPDNGDSSERLIEVADQALYESKKNGRNRVTIAQKNSLETTSKQMEKDKTITSPQIQRTIEDRIEVHSLSELGAVRGVPHKMTLAGKFLYFLDRSSNQIHIYDIGMKDFINSIGKRGDAVDELESPSDLVVTNDKKLWVVDSASHAIKRFSSDGTFEMFIGNSNFAGEPVAGNTRGTFTMPIAIATNNAGKLYVAEGGKGRVQRFAEDGRFDNLEVSLYDVEVDVPFEKYSTSVDVDKNGNIYILDANNNYIYKFDNDGKYISSIGGMSQTGETGRFKDLSALCIDSSGVIAQKLSGLRSNPGFSETSEILITAERGDVSRLQFFTPDGDYIASIDFDKIFLKERNVVPVDIAIGERGGIYIVDLENSDILLIQLAKDS